MKHLVLGGPGSGKTTRLLEIMEKELERGTPPDKIAFISFTRKAVLEATERARVKFNLSKDDLPYFRTLHAMCYRELGLSNKEILATRHFREIGEALGLDIKGNYDINNMPTTLTAGDRILFMEGFARSTKQPLKEVWRMSDAEFGWYELKLFVDTLNAYKKENALYDFTDLLEMFCGNCFPLPIEVAIIDEAQDLNPLQWDVAWFATAEAKRTYIAGDDDQAIYRWSGADVQQFLNIDENILEVLPVSYRLPETVFNFATGIANRISKRYTKDWNSRPAEGSVDFVRDPEHIELNEDSWLLLARNSHLLKPYLRMVEEQGFAYSTKKGSSIDARDVQAIKGYETYREGKFISGKLINEIRKLMDMPETELESATMYNDHGGHLPDRGIWHDALTGIPLSRREYYLSILRRGRSLTQDPKIHIDTIHSSKGGEADHVVLMTDLTRKTHEHFYKEEDDEHRVFYVGATRAKQSLTVVLPQTSRYYAI